jgi:hypothetical protein
VCCRIGWMDQAACSRSSGAGGGRVQNPMTAQGKIPPGGEVTDEMRTMLRNSGVDVILVAFGVLVGLLSRHLASHGTRPVVPHAGARVVCRGGRARASTRQRYCPIRGRERCASAPARRSAICVVGRRAALPRRVRRDPRLCR